MDTLNLKDQWVVVTGASSGLGREMAIQLATQHQANIIIIARRTQQLETLKEEIRKVCASEVVIFTLDVSDINAVKTFSEHILIKYDIRALVLNAGVTYFGAHKALDLPTKNQILNVNIHGSLEMLTIFHNHFVSKNSPSGILVISSMGAYHPVPYQALYSGTKAFLFNFAYALGFENENPNYQISIFTPGGIQTEMTSDKKFNKLKSWMMPVDVAAKEAIKTLITRKRVYIPGFFNRIGNYFMHLIPKSWIGNQMATMYKKSLGLNS
jgi:short-subunit dehydrogenase